MNTGISISLKEMMERTKSEGEPALVFQGFRRGFVGSLLTCGTESEMLLASILIDAAAAGTRIFLATEKPVHRIKWLLAGQLKARGCGMREKWLENIFAFFSGNALNCGVAPAWCDPDLAVIDPVGSPFMGGRDLYDRCDLFCREWNAGVLVLGSIGGEWEDFTIRCDWASAIERDGDSFHIVSRRHLFRESCAEHFRLSDGVFSRCLKSAANSKRS